MDLPVRVHIARIQREIEALQYKQMRARDRAEANEAESHIRSLKLALAHYELALKLEKEVLERERSVDAGQSDAAD